jgi:hypothetical protein
LWPDVGRACQDARVSERIPPPDGARGLDLSARDVNLPSAARVNNLLKRGTSHFLPDRQVAAAIMEVEPNIGLMARRNVDFSHRVVRELVSRGVDQFIDLGCGLPAAETGPLHQAAWNLAPAARFVYVDNDPHVLQQVRVLVSGDERTAYLHADMRSVDAIFSSPQCGILDMSRPVAFLFFASLHFLHPGDDPAGLIDQMGARAAAGSYLALSHVSHEEFDADGRVTVQAAFDAVAPGMVCVRTQEEIAALFGGRQLLDPGVGYIIDWRPEVEVVPTKLRNIGGVAYL